jgi:parallel beta-helix repeat protein
VLIDGVRLTPSTLAPGSLPANSFRYVAGQGLYVDFGGVNPGTHVVQVSHRNYGFTLSTKSFVTIDGFEITRTQDRGINIFGCSDLDIANNKVTFANSYGIQAVGSQNLVIEGNLVTDSNFHGIGLTASTTSGTTGCIVRNNECTRNAHPTIRQANGIYLTGSPNNTMYGNRLHHNQDTGMHFALGSNDCLSYNNLSYANVTTADHLTITNTTHGRRGVRELHRRILVRGQCARQGKVSTASRWTTA